MANTPSVQPVLTHRPRVVSIDKVVQETPTIRSFLFRDAALHAAEPAQFGMVWIPGHDEIPMSILSDGASGMARIALKPWEKGSLALYGMREGTRIGVRGPYGHGFSYHDTKHPLLVGGGTGIVPLTALTQKLTTNKIPALFVMAAKTKTELLFADTAKRALQKADGELITATDDGSEGVNGTALDATANLLRERRFDAVFTCGPEVMMRQVFELAEARGLPFQASLEREFKCGSGICGSCCIGPFLVCKDGPVFPGEVLRSLDEFGKSAREASGKIIKFDEKQTASL